MSTVLVFVRVLVMVIVFLTIMAVVMVFLLVPVIALVVVMGVVVVVLFSCQTWSGHDRVYGVECGKKDFLDGKKT